ncbi:MAG TPA: SWIM zinc finger family protein [Longimicrobiales bacterium]|nr:SWIM zinc finger family protein [Longimicrobiales bacterium]
MNLGDERPGRARIDYQAAGGVEAGRLERSLGLRVTRVGRGRYRVEGGREAHWVDLYTARLPRCDCGDHLWRERICKHILAVMLREGDERVIGEVGRLVEQLREDARELRRVAKRRKPEAA